MNEEIERMAREYKQALSNGESDKTPLERLVLLEENQLELLSDLGSFRSALSARTVGYVKNLIFRSLRDLNVLLGNDSYVPDVRTRQCAVPSSKAVLSVYDQQISILITLDRIPDVPQSLLIGENRKTSLIVALLR